MEPTNEAHSTIQPLNNSTSSACEHCGSFDVLEIAGKSLCADCVALAGGGGAGQGGDED
jgi:hypothetical protein